MKKTFALVLALVMIIGCFTACGKPAENAPAAANEQPLVSETAPSAENEIVNIHVFQRGANGNPMEAEVIAAMNEYSAEKIGVTITFEAIAAAEFTEALSRKIAAKEELDVAFCASYTGLNDLINKGGLLDLTDLLKQDEYSALRAVMPEEVWDASTNSGRNYCVPNYKETPYSLHALTPQGLADTIKDKYGIDYNAIEIGSFRELNKLTDYLVAAQKEGIKYPALSNEANTSLTSLAQSDTEFELVGTDYFSPFMLNKETKQVVSVFEDPAFLPYFENMKNWNELGLWSEDNISLTFDPRPFVNSQDYAMYIVSEIPDQVAQQSATYGHPVYSIPIGPATILSTGTLGSTWTIPAYSDKVEAAMKWIQLVETDQAYADMFIFGIEGVNYNRISDQIVELIPDSGWSNATWKTTCFETPSIKSTDNPNLKELYREFNAKGVPGILNGFIPDYSNVESEMAAATAIFNEVYHLYTLGFMTADDLADTVAQFKAAGTDKIIAELQSQVDAFLAQ